MIPFAHWTGPNCGKEPLAIGLAVLLSVYCCSSVPSPGAAPDIGLETVDAGECTIDPAATTWGTDFSVVEPPEPQTLDAASWLADIHPDPSSCAELGIVACRVVGCQPHILCWNASGQTVEIFTAQSAIPCTKEQFSQWLMSDQAECTRSVALSELPGVATMLLATEKFSTTVCSNSSGTRFRLDGPSGSARVVFWPDSCTHGIHAQFAGWTICGSPATADVWVGGAPFMQCPSWYKSIDVDRTAIGKVPKHLVLAMHTDCATKCVLPYSGDAADDPEWPNYLAAVSGEFAMCP